jgi:uncharacterized protein (TIGR02271 family)
MQHMNTLVALYDTMEQARQAVQALENAGFNRENISLVAYNGTNQQVQVETPGTTTDGAATGATAGAVIGGIGGLLVGLGALVIPGIGPVLAAGPLAAGLSALLGAGIGAAAGGMLGVLADAGIPEEEAGYYAEGIRRGGALLTAQVDDHRADEARGILENYNPVNVDERAATWKEEGWTGYSKDAKPYTEQQIAAERARYSSANVSNQNLDKGGQVSIPVVEEKVNINKQEVKTGGVRVHKYVTEQPVDADVTLRQEHVSVERRPVDRAATAGVADTFKETTFDVTEKGEQVVVNKEARVVEEVVVRKDVEQRTEKVHDTVRRTDVEVEQTGKGKTGSSYATGWHAHYDKTFAGRGQEYTFYEPAYQYGESLRNEARYRDWDWKRLEPEARRTWESRYDSPWDQIRGAVRYAWENVKAAVS